jgi:MFS family permease
VQQRLTELFAPLRQPEVRSLVSAQLVSGLGDWAGRLALSVVVYDRSQSALWTVMVTVVSLLPWIGLGQLLATYADRLGRVRVMVISDIARAVLFAAMLIPQPIWMLLLLAFLAGLAVPPFAGARAATMVEVVDPDLYPSSLALSGVFSQVEVLAGYAGGGIVVALIGAETALAVNAVTFLLSALLLRSLRSTAADVGRDDAEVGLGGLKAGVAVWRSDPVCLRALVLFVGVSMFMILPEVLVVPFTDEIGVSDGFIGAFAALIAVGSIIGMVMMPKAIDHVALLRVAAGRAGLLAAGAAALFSLGTVPAIAGAAFMMSGAVDAIAIPTNQVVGERLPAAGRSAAMAVAGGAQYVGQIVAITAAGISATFTSARIPLIIGMVAAGLVCVWALVQPLADPRRGEGRT